MGHFNNTLSLKANKMRTVLALLASLAAVVSGQMRADPGPDCWYPSNICAFGVADGVLRQEAIDTVANPTADLQAMACYGLCKAEGGCTDFTLFVSSRMSTCYLLDNCQEDSEAVCIEKGNCISGPADCVPVSVNADCPQIDKANTAAGNIHWQCSDGDGASINGYTESSIKAGSSCLLRCESWEALDGSDGFLNSECLADGTWSVPLTNNGEAELSFPAKPEAGDYPKPNEVQPYACGCKDLNVVWPLGEGVLPADQFSYDPSTEMGTDFVCKDTIDTATGEFIINTDNSCKLFCDSYLLADVRCVNGEWTGQPELGFWCYDEPSQDDALTPAPGGPE